MFFLLTNNWTELNWWCKWNYRANEIFGGKWDAHHEVCVLCWSAKPVRCFVETLADLNTNFLNFKCGEMRLAFLRCIKMAFLKLSFNSRTHTHSQLWLQIFFLRIWDWRVFNCDWWPISDVSKYVRMIKNVKHWLAWKNLKFFISQFYLMSVCINI